MRAVIPKLTPDIVAWRKRTGVDQWDEMWDGVVHMPPAPNYDHQELEGTLEAWLRQHWMPRSRGQVAHQINVASPGGWPDRNYRVPDLVLLTPERFSINRNEYFEGGPDVVVEIHSPGDEAHEKLPFYAEIGVIEVWIIDRDTRAPEVYALEGTEYRRASPNAAGWLESERTGIELRGTDEKKLALRIAGEDATTTELPQR